MYFQQCARSASDRCHEATDFYLFERALRLYFSVITTHILSGEVDTSLSEEGFLSKVSWLCRYFNPVNLCWRYYSIVAYRVLAKSWGEKQLSLINFEGYPYRSPIPFVVGETVEEYHTARLEVCGVLSSQGILSIIAAFQGIFAIEFVFSTKDNCFLATVSKPIALLGLFRFMVSKWLASRVHVEPFPYPTLFNHLAASHYKSNRLVTSAWLGTLTGLVGMAIRPFITYSQVHLRYNFVEFSMDILYSYFVVSCVGFHLLLLSHGPRALANRILYFDHWIYKLQTAGFLFLMLAFFACGIVDFVLRDFYRHCEF